MKKNILIAMLTLITLSSFVYAYIKAKEAQLAEIEVQEQKEIAMELRQQAEELRMEAEKQAELARRQTQLAEQARIDCENAK